MNAQGKTNIIEVAFLSALGKSFRLKKKMKLYNMGKMKK